MAAKVTAKIKCLAADLGARLRFRHLRGHGVHSPFVYSLVRDVFMKRRLTDKHRDGLYKELLKNGVGKFSATQLQNLHTYCGYENYNILGGDDARGETVGAFNIFLPGFSGWETLAEAASSGVIVIMAPYKSERRMKACVRLTDAKYCPSIDKRRYMIFFGDKTQPVQHFKL